jgi:hypothetical protein
MELKSLELDLQSIELNPNSTKDKWHANLLKKYWKFVHHFHHSWLQCWKKVASESTLWGGQDCCHIVLFFIGLMFELQPCIYYEGFSQCSCRLW